MAAPAAIVQTLDLALAARPQIPLRKPDVPRRQPKKKEKRKEKSQRSRSLRKQKQHRSQWFTARTPTRLICRLGNADLENLFVVFFVTSSLFIIQ